MQLNIMFSLRYIIGFLMPLVCISSTEMQILIFLKSMAQITLHSADISCCSTFENASMQFRKQFRPIPHRHLIDPDSADEKVKIYKYPKYHAIWRKINRLRQC